MQRGKVENATAEMLRGLDQLMERKEGGGMYLLWVPLIGDVRTLMMDEAHASRVEVGDKVMLEVSSWKDVLHFGKKEMLAPRNYWTDANLDVHLEEIKVDKTLRFAEEPVEIINYEVKSLKRSRIPIVKSIGTRSELDEIQSVALSSRGEREDLVKAKYFRLFVDDDVEPIIIMCLCDLMRVGYKSIERDRLMVIKVMVAMDISLCSHFSDNENDGKILVACRDLEAAFEYPEDRSIIKEKARRERSKSRGKRSRHQEISSDSEHEEGSEDAYEDLNSPYKRPKPTPFTQSITHFKYHRRAKLSRNIRVYEGNKDPEDHLGIFSTAAEQEEWPMPGWCKMFRQTLGGVAQNWFDNLDPKSVDSFEELSQKFLEEFSQ
ncbi:hypothetical protein Tco_0862452 [Tanacetum coccineum]